MRVPSPRANMTARVVMQFDHTFYVLPPCERSEHAPVRPQAERPRASGASAPPRGAPLRYDRHVSYLLVAAGGALGATARFFSPISCTA
jgi:hypothetical protein